MGIHHKATMHTTLSTAESELVGIEAMTMGECLQSGQSVSFECP